MESAQGFVLFGTGHLLTLGVVAALAVAVARLAAGAGGDAQARILAVLLVAQELVKLYAFIGVLDHPWQRSLPLDLCRINELLCTAMLLTRRYRLFEVAYFWSMAGSVGAMATPDLAHGFPHPLFALFFLGHGLVVLAVVHAIAGFGFRPRFSSLLLALAVSAGYAALIAPVNLLLDANYLFLREPPESATLIGLLGPWPVYLLGLFALSAVLSALAYLPFARFWRG